MCLRNIKAEWVRGTLLRDEVRELTGGEGADHVGPYRPWQPLVRWGALGSFEWRRAWSSLPVKRIILKSSLRMHCGGDGGGGNRNTSEQAIAVIQKRDDDSFRVIALESKSGQVQEICRYWSWNHQEFLMDSLWGVRQREESRVTQGFQPEQLVGWRAISWDGEDHGMSRFEGKFHFWPIKFATSTTYPSENVK